MKKCVMMFVLVTLLLMACAKKQPVTVPLPETPVVEKAPACSRSVITDKEVKIGDAGITLPAGTHLCFSEDQLELTVTLPSGYGFLTREPSNKTLPVFATYACYCSAGGTACQVFYAEGGGFGCLHSSCSGACTGKFTYKGYTVDKVISLQPKENFFQLPEVMARIAAMQITEAFTERTVFGIPFYLVRDEQKFLSQASCNCEGTSACVLKVIPVAKRPGALSGLKIYYCEGRCNGCELTVN